MNQKVDVSTRSRNFATLVMSRMPGETDANGFHGDDWRTEKIDRDVPRDVDGGGGGAVLRILVVMMNLKWMSCHCQNFYDRQVANPRTTSSSPYLKRSISDDTATKNQNHFRLKLLSLFYYFQNSNSRFDGDPDIHNF